LRNIRRDKRFRFSFVYDLRMDSFGSSWIYGADAVPSIERCPQDAEELTGLSLRGELSQRGSRFALANGHLHERTDGASASVLFGHDEQGRHGNFEPQSYASIRTNPAWSKRLSKAHTGYRRARAKANWVWKELDCATSSDALLMNIFCYPGVLRQDNLCAILGHSDTDVPLFGFRPRTPLKQMGRDATEIDMKLGSLLVEAKLTESDFQVADLRLLQQYEMFEDVFNCDALPLRRGKYAGYQLVRGALAAYASECSFAVFCDARRPDLIEEWYMILASVHRYDFRCRLKLLTWQELAAAVPKDLQLFLELKYGIFASKVSSF
jgi:hypothetical protein